MADLFELIGPALAGRYRVERELGRGGMGIVLLAEDLKHSRKVAVKVLRPEVSQGVSAERFLREIRIAAQLSHPNILQLIDSGDANGFAYFVMPFVEGESLRDRLNREKQLPIDDALQLAREVADALSYAHEHGVIHRDIKPENILLGSGHALVTDFGIARALSEGSRDKLTETGIAIGTPAYMSPEQAHGTGELDHRTDIYSLGCVLYEMLSGSPPFSGSSLQVMARKAVESVPGLRVVRDTVPVIVEQVIMKSLARVPADRFASARQFSDALAGDRRTLEALGARRMSSRQRWLLAGAAVSLLLIAGTYVLVAGAPWKSRASAGVGATAHSVQITSAPGAEWFPSLSTDGKWVVYSGLPTGNRDIYLQSVTGQLPINLTKDTPENDDQPAFSRDGERIAFRSERDGGGLFVMGRTGENVRRVTTRGFRPSWSPDGTRIAFTTERVEMNPGNSEGGSELWVVSADGTGAGERKLNAGDAIFASWSPHGHRIAFSHRLGAPAQGDIWTISPDSGAQPVPVMSDRARDWSPAWSPDGKYIYYSSDRGGSMNLWRIAVDEASGAARGEPEPVTTPATFLAHPSVGGGGGDRVAYTSGLVTINIQRLTVDPGAGTTVGEPAPVTTGTRQWVSPDISPQGDWVAFYTLNQPEGDIYVSRPDGSGLRQLTSDTVIDRLPRFSPDGRTIGFFSTRAGQLNIWAIGFDGSDPRRLTFSPSAYFAWSPDGTRIAAVMGVGTAQDTTAIVDVASTRRIESLPRSTVGSFLANSWSADGKRLVGRIASEGNAGRGVAVYDFATKTYEKLTDFGEWPVWMPDSRRVLFVANGNAFYLVDSRTRQVRKIFSVAHDVLGPPRVARDGRTIVFSRRVTEGDVWLLTFAPPR